MHLFAVLKLARSYYFKFKIQIEIIFSAF